MPDTASPHCRGDLSLSWRPPQAASLLPAGGPSYRLISIFGCLVSRSQGTTTPGTDTRVRFAALPHVITGVASPPLRRAEDRGDRRSRRGPSSHLDPSEPMASLRTDDRFRQVVGQNEPTRAANHTHAQRPARQTGHPPIRRQIDRPPQREVVDAATGRCELSSVVWRKHSAAVQARANAVTKSSGGPTYPGARCRYGDRCCDATPLLAGHAQARTDRRGRFGQSAWW